MHYEFRKLSSVALIFSLLMVAAVSLSAQERLVVDKTVAVVGDGIRYELITYSDLMWQLALQPGVDLQPARSDDLARALEILINQRTFALEAERLPREAPTDREVAAKISETLRAFPNPAVFETRLKLVGFDSVRDKAFERLIAKRVAIEKYIDFRFGAFVVITSDEEEKYYREQFSPEFRRSSPGRLLPTFAEARGEIRNVLTRQKIAAAIERFLDEAQPRVEIEILSDV